MAADKRSLGGTIAETPIRQGAASLVPEHPPGTPSGGGAVPFVPRKLDPRYISEPRFANRLQRLLAMATSAPVDGYIAEIVAALVLNRVGAEDLYPEERIGYGVGSSTSAGGLITLGELFNPANSNVLIIVEQVTLAQVTLASQLGFSFNTAQLANPRTAFGGDGRGVDKTGGGGGGGVRGLISFDGTLAAKPGTATADFWNVAFPAGSQPLVVPVEIVLPPGLGLLVDSGAQGAQTTTVAFKWREVAIPQ